MGLPYLLPVFAAVFLGSTAIKVGRFNIVGTLVGVLFLQVISTGLIMLELKPAYVNIVQGVAFSRPRCCWPGWGVTVAAPETLVRVTGLRKTFGDFVAVDGVDIEVNAGEIVGLLGKNGAGKSTVIKILAGVERADAGDIELCGHQVRPERHTTAQARALGLAVMFQELGIYPGMTVAENVALGTRLPHRFGGLVDDSRLNERVRQTLLTVNPAIDPKAGTSTRSDRPSSGP